MFDDEYLFAPTKVDMPHIHAQNEAYGFAGILGSIDFSIGYGSTIWSLIQLLY